MSRELIDEGWNWLHNSNKAHYFRNGTSLCGRWLYLGKNFEHGNDNSLDNCSSCKKKKQKGVSE